ncbi:MAG: hypothetical protein ABIL44_01030 [candidate division WOR-3 bacterium]
MKKGTILEFRGSWLSGIATLVIKDERGKIKEIPCDNTATVRALDACYGNVIQSGRTVSQKPFVGKKIFYEYDEMGLVLGRFVPVCDFCEKNPAVRFLDGQYICKKCIGAR